MCFRNAQCRHQWQTIAMKGAIFYQSVAESGSFSSHMLTQWGWWATAGPLQPSSISTFQTKLLPPNNKYIIVFWLLLQTCYIFICASGKTKQASLDQAMLHGHKCFQLAFSSGVYPNTWDFTCKIWVSFWQFVHLEQHILQNALVLHRESTSVLWANFCQVTVVFHLGLSWIILKFQVWFFFFFVAVFFNGLGEPFQWFEVENSTCQALCNFHLNEPLQALSMVCSHKCVTWHWNGTSAILDRKQLGLSFRTYDSTRLEIVIDSLKPGQTWLPPHHK